jgi:hypothetical protein
LKYTARHGQGEALEKAGKRIKALEAKMAQEGLV